MGKRDKLNAVDEALREDSYTTEQMLAVINATNSKRCYYPELANVLGRDAAILLTQMEWRWGLNGKEAFYKYISACKSSRKGDSWAEELGMSSHSVGVALDLVGTRVRGPVRAKELLQSGTECKHIIVYYLPKDGAMRWYFNERLFLKLRASLLLESGIPIPKISETANLHTMENGQFANNANTYSEQTQNQTKQKEENFNVAAALEDDSGWVDPRNPKKQKKVKEKANKETYKPPTEIIENTRYGEVMPLDFSVSSSTMALAIETYGDEAWVKGEQLKFIDNYTNTNPTFKVVDWNKRFINKWLVDAWGYREANEKRYGTTKNAGAERLSRLEELATTDIFGDTSFEDLGRSIYEDLYGSDEGGIDS